ncbi:AT-rich interactive domain-containing protein 5A-like isoform X2 [Hypanus sabinus]|uniref:AT-rich interactive domain-containing protein 5A-like isoform X2 n=2 Tax=Hypanus sabinus TaxID=79690 RepID=UPI0028C4BDA4|nr:AT-rich interactive domain-containing protein 5A-like isoform X2 [Hypanus sabinus]
MKPISSGLCEMALGMEQGLVTQDLSGVDAGMVWDTGGTQLVTAPAGETGASWIDGGADGEPGMAEGLEAAKEADSGDMSQQSFLVNLYKFMKDRGTPIERIPHLGFKQVNLATLYKAVEKLGGYEVVTTSRLWKNIYDELGGNPGSTSAATCTRRHYEKLVLPYERHLKGEEDKPLPASKPRKQYRVVKAKDGKGSGTELKDQGNKRKAAKDVQQIGGSNAASPLAEAEDSGRGQNEGAPPGPATAEERECPQVESAEKGGGRSPGRAGEEVWGAGGGAEEGQGPKREQDIISPLAKKKRFAATELPLARPSVIQPPRPAAPVAPLPLYPARDEKGSRGCELPFSGLQLLQPFPTRASPMSRFRGFRDLSAFVLPLDKGSRRPGRPGDRAAELALPRVAPWVPEPKGEALRVGPLPAPSHQPKACWVPPLTVALPRKVPAKRAKLDGALLQPRPELRTKDCETNCYGRKLRVVSPLQLAREPEGKDRQAGEGKALKSPLPAVPGWLLAAPGFPDAAVTDGLRAHFPAGYVLPVKEHPLYSTLPTSLALNPFVVPAVPGEGLGVPLDLYKHLAASSSCDSLLHNRLCPLACYTGPYLPAWQVRPQL